MTNEEAIRILGEQKPLSPLGQACFVGIEAIKKQTSKKVICETADENGIEYEFEHYCCPNCKLIIHQRYKKAKEPMRYKQNYCHDCGQPLDWSD